MFAFREKIPIEAEGFFKQQNTYTVVAGDTLSEIAYAHGYNGWEELAAANADIIPNPHVIEVGQVLTLPAL